MRGKKGPRALSFPSCTPDMGDNLAVQVRYGVDSSDH
jgi:hypothetical protein